ncbi:MAG: hypothetical protein ACC707_16310 [Thiohalomonadales bacterium]
MKIKDNLILKDNVEILLFGPDGKLKERRTAHNLVVTVGKNWIAQRIDDDINPTAMGWMACGTGSTSPVVGNTTLETELARVALSTTTVAAATTTYAATFPAGTGTGALTELGILNAVSAGTLLARVTFAVVNKLAADTLAINWGVSAT